MYSALFSGIPVQSRLNVCILINSTFQLKIYPQTNEPHDIGI
jgi:hypothetical protein